MKVKFLSNGWRDDRRHVADEVRIVSRAEGAQLVADGVAEALTREPAEDSGTGVSEIDGDHPGQDSVPDAGDAVHPGCVLAAESERADLRRRRSRRR